MGWVHDKKVRPDGTSHAWPDYEPGHELTGTLCWCIAEIDKRATGVLVVKHRDQLDRLHLDWEAS